MHRALDTFTVALACAVVVALSLFAIVIFGDWQRTAETAIRETAAAPYHEQQTEAYWQTVIAQGEILIEQGQPTATPTPTRATPKATTQALDYCPAFGIDSAVKAGDICLMPRATDIPKATATPIKPCSQATPREYADVPCVWEGLP
jgi:hypothetical protein